MGLLQFSMHVPYRLLFSLPLSHSSGYSTIPLPHIAIVVVGGGVGWGVGANVGVDVGTVVGDCVVGADVGLRVFLVGAIVGDLCVVGATLGL